MTLINALTVDVEDYFQVSAFADRISRKDWDKVDCRVAANTDKLLSIFDDHEVQGTFFILGWVAERYPKLVKRIHSAGHEIASHGYWHQLVYDLTPEEFAKDLQALPSKWLEMSRRGGHCFPRAQKSTLGPSPKRPASLTTSPQ